MSIDFGAQVGGPIIKNSRGQWRIECGDNNTASNYQSIGYPPSTTPQAALNLYNASLDTRDAAPDTFNGFVGPHPQTANTKAAHGCMEETGANTRFNLAKIRFTALGLAHPDGPGAFNVFNGKLEYVPNSEARAAQAVLDAAAQTLLDLRKTSSV